MRQVDNERAQHHQPDKRDGFSLIMFTVIARLTRSLFGNWQFACAMAGRDALALNRGSLLGLAWLAVRPLIQVGAYVVIVSYVFQTRLGEQQGRFDYVLYVLSGLVVWQMVQRALEDAPSLLRDRMDIVKQMAYPIETLPVTTMLAHVTAPAVGLCTYMVLALVSGKLTWSCLLLPVPALLLAALLLGLSWSMMIVGVVIKDLREVIAVILGLLVYVSPVLVAESMVSDTMWVLLMLNPLAHVVIAFRDVLLGTFHPSSWAVFAVMSMGSLLFGAWLLDHMKQTINEYL